MKNRLRTMRKAKEKTQSEIASIVGIAQNAYSYWENGKVKIDHESLLKLSDYYGVSVDFLMGKRYVMRKPLSLWEFDQKEDYDAANDYLKEYLEYLYGDIVFVGSGCEDAPNTYTKEKPADEGELSEDVIIYHRDGKTVKQKFTKKQMDTILMMIDAMVEKPKDI